MRIMLGQGEERDLPGQAGDAGQKAEMSSSTQQSSGTVVSSIERQESEWKGQSELEDCDLVMIRGQ